MKIIRYIILFLLQWTWGAVQNVIGLAMFIGVKALHPGCRAYFYHGAVVCHWHSRGSMGMGMFIFFGHGGTPQEARILAHEYGHILQSRLLGPLDLPLIGLPSFMWATRSKNIQYRHRHGVSYYSYYTEKWRNKLAQYFLKQQTPD